MSFPILQHGSGSTATKLMISNNGFKNTHSISNMGLVAYNKRFLNIADGLPVAPMMLACYDILTFIRRSLMERTS